MSIVEKLKSGDEEAVEKVRATVRKVCKKILGRSFEDAEQDSYAIIWTSVETFKGNSSFLTWVNRVAFNECMKHLKKAKSLSTIGSISVEPVDPTSEQEDLPVEELRRAIEELDPRQREAIQGKLDGKTSKQIAEEMEITINNLWQIQFSARQKLKEALS